MNVRGRERLRGALRLPSVGDRAVHAVEEVADRLARAERGFEARLVSARLPDRAVERRVFWYSWEVAGAGIVGFVTAVADLAVQVDAVQIDTVQIDTGVAADSTAEPTGPVDARPSSTEPSGTADELLDWGAGWAATMTDGLIVVTELLLRDLSRTSDHDGGALDRTALTIVWPVPADGESSS